MDRFCDRVVRRFRSRAIAIRALRPNAGVRGLYPAIARPRHAGLQHHDKAAARSNYHDRSQPERGADGARHLQRAECVLAGLLHGHPAIPTGRAIIQRGRIERDEFNRHLTLAYDFSPLFRIMHRLYCVITSLSPQPEELALEHDEFKLIVIISSVIASHRVARMRSMTGSAKQSRGHTHCSCLGPRTASSLRSPQ
jgi:hypothetical protein